MCIRDSEYPGQIKPRGVESDGRVAQAHLLVENYRYGHHRHGWQAVGKGERRYPKPGFASETAIALVIGGGMLSVVVHRTMVWGVTCKRAIGSYS